ncbi:excinuclease ABC subunit A [Colwellia sp. E2M01]|uniref:excinuclease ABC subunit A n=1 Tax=Colwellia sp. E2M01 TaxID=2841561 RepID=UPI001C086E3E|nr:excinuclease ABC subunit A [Colwellia sp. E2M01]MBU2871019.1 excinuclease ABC subunit A [Colwellia sp. E2M01]
MNKSLLFILLASTSMTSMARDDIADYSVDEAMSINKISSAVGEGVDFYFADQKHSKVIESFGEFQSNKKTNAFAKSDKEACQWAFASAMKTFRQRAIKEGGNAVINIRSNYKGNLTSNKTTFKCGAGAIMAGVTLVGDVVKIDKK